MEDKTINTTVENNKNKTECNEPDYLTKLGFNCIDLINYFDMDYCNGSFVKYIYSAGLKEETKQSELDDLIKAKYYIENRYDSVGKGKKYTDKEDTFDWIRRIGEVKDHFKREVLIDFITDYIIEVVLDFPLENMINDRIKTLQNEIANGE